MIFTNVYEQENKTKHCNLIQEREEGGVRPYIQGSARVKNAALMARVSPTSHVLAAKLAVANAVEPKRRAMAMDDGPGK